MQQRDETSGGWIAAQVFMHSIDELENTVGGAERETI